MLLKPNSNEIAPRDGRAERPAPARPHGSDAWILLGGLDAALYQCGVVSVWLERLDAPSQMFAGGMSALNAVLARAHDPLAFRIGWERVRAAHMLAQAAVQRSPLLRYLRDGHQEPLDLGRLLSSTVLCSEGSALHLLVGGGFVEAITGTEHAPASLIEETLRAAPTASALATAIDAAAARGCSRILIPGVEDRRIGQREVARAIEDGRAHGAEIVFLPLSTRQRPGVIGYLLPGLGRADRLLRDGRRAALRWLDGSGPDRTGTTGVAA